MSRLSKITFCIRRPGFVLAVIAGLALLGPVPGQAQNLLENGDFNLPATTEAPGGWKLWTYAKAKGAAWVNHAKDTNSDDGSFYMQVGSDENGSSGAGLYQIVPAASGYLYHLSVDSAAQAWWWPKAEMRLFCLDISNNVLSESVADVTSGISGNDRGLGWSHYTLSVISPAGTARVKVEFASQSGTGTVFFDNAALTKEASPLPGSPFAREILPPSSPYGSAIGIKNIPYTRPSTPRQNFDLYLPEGPHQRPFPLIVWIHGGAWMMGVKDWDNVKYLVGHGYAIASIGYRFSPEATFPAQIQDCNAALDFILAHAAGYGVDSNRFIIGGASAGGHLALLLGLARNQSAFGAEPAIRPVAILDFFGPTDLNHMAEDLTAIHSQTGLDLWRDAGAKLLGAPAQDCPDKARFASPLTYVTTNSAPVLILQGDKDNLVPVNQSRRLEAELNRARVKNQLIVVAGAGHDGPLFSTPEVAAKVIAFLNGLGFTTD